MLRLGFLVATIFGLLCGLAACAMPQAGPVQGAATQSPLPPLRIPPPEPIAGLYPGYVLVETGDLDQGDAAIFLDEEALANDPWALSWVRADFDGNGVVDHAVLIRTPDGLLPVYESFAILMGSLDGQYEIAHEYSQRGFVDYLIIREVQIGTTVREFRADDGPELQVRLMYPAVEVGWVGKAASVYYWNPSTESIEVIGTAD